MTISGAGKKDDKGNWKTAYEVWQYGNDGLRTVTVVSSFNPNKYKTNKSIMIIPIRNPKSTRIP